MGSGVVDYFFGHQHFDFFLNHIFDKSQSTARLLPAKIFVTIFLDGESEYANVFMTCLDVVDYFLLGHLLFGPVVHLEFTLLQ